VAAGRFNTHWDNIKESSDNFGGSDAAGHWLRTTRSRVAWPHLAGRRGRVSVCAPSLGARAKLSYRRRRTGGGGAGELLVEGRGGKGVQRLRGMAARSGKRAPAGQEARRREGMCQCSAGEVARPPCGGWGACGGDEVGISFVKFFNSVLPICLFRNRPYRW
jgi:hypothetical protein